MPRTPPPTPTSPKALYPVVKDLTDAEYGNSSGAGTGLCCNDMLGSFALEDLALPNIRALQMQQPPLVPPLLDLPESRVELKRRNSLIHSSAGAPLSSSSIGSDIPVPRNDDTASLTCMADDESHADTVSRRFDDSFVLTRQVYRRNVSTVWECVHRDTGNRYCVKMTDKRRFTCRADDEAAIREISILTALQEFQCRHLPRVIHVTEDENRYYLVMDYVQGGNLSMMIQIQHHFSELHVQAIGRSLLLAVADMHRLSLGHFNLSPENILLRAGATNEVVLCDFGCALDLRFSKGMGSGTNAVSNLVGISPRYGALCYAAPELLGNDQEYGLAADLWSVGVILYELLCGRLPFEDVSKRALKDKISAGKFKFTGSEWHIVSRSAKQFISSLLHPDPQVRLTVGEALGHPWIVLSRYGDESPGSPKKAKLRNQLKRLFGRSREVETEQLEHEPVGSKQRITNPPKLPDLSTDSTLTDSDSYGAGSSISLLPSEQAWDATLPRPLEYYRRPRLVGM